MLPNMNTHGKKVALKTILLTELHFDCMTETLIKYMKMMTTSKNKASAYTGMSMEYFI